MNERARKVLRLALEIVVLVVIYALIFNITGFGIPCVFRVVTGLKCPGCGMTHALGAMLQGDFRAAAGYNILSVTLVPILGIYFLLKVVQYVRKGEQEFKILEVVFLLMCAILCLCYFFIRNNII